ncbi:hypothetical protein M404DRAFT_999910 [Pisolithus tinctorius Marx 270]|uniref:Uncharacterized protein n=1 Tax=Pisolithus tinctorius Marx 270 TaxID=870435 RepID=A0A0C3PBH4_PISTI|nr:hypothetical protein M404DRAFT_999910 [Pisolithus tinctorius Marx 270]
MEPATVDPSTSWTESKSQTTMSYDDYDAEGDLDVEQGIDLEYDGRTRLDKTIDRIGMGSYQWTLLSLCGFGECRLREHRVLLRDAIIVSTMGTDVESYPNNRMARRQYVDSGHSNHPSKGTATLFRYLKLPGLVLSPSPRVYSS